MGSERHWFEAVADHLGPAYLRYSFTKGTEQEVDFLVDALGLAPGQRVLDVGCGPGRHAHALGHRGLSVVGVDVAARFVELARQDAPPNVTFVRADARDLGYDEEFDAVLSLCEGAFGLGGPRSASDPDPDTRILAGMARALRPGGVLALSAFSAYFQVRYLEEGDRFDPATGTNHERSVLRDEAGREVEGDLWTTCFTPRELRLLAGAAGLEVEHLGSVTPGAYSRQAPDLGLPELLLIARKRPGASLTGGAGG